MCNNKVTFYDGREYVKRFVVDDQAGHPLVHSVCGTVLITERSMIWI